MGWTRRSLAITLLVAVVAVASCASETDTTTDAAVAAPAGAVTPATTAVEANDAAADETASSNTTPPTSSTEPPPPDSGDEASGGDDASPPATEPVPDEDSGAESVRSDNVELEALLDDLIAFVETNRGHEFVTRPVVEIFTGDDFVAEFVGILERESSLRAAEFADSTDIYQALGIIEPSQTVEGIFASFADAGVIGFYDPPSERIVLRGGELDVLTETTLVHELVHALDDQIFDIDRPEYDDRTDEVGWTLAALVEGTAGVIEDRYRATLTPDQIAEEQQAIRDLPRGTSLRVFTNSFLELQYSRYEIGRDWVSELWEQGRDAVDAAYVTPPVTSELVMTRGLYVAGAEPDPPAPVPVADGAVFDEGLFGQLAWSAVLLDAVDPEVAADAAAGWGGDWYVAWRQGDVACVRVNVAADSPADLDDYADALEVWARNGDREVYYPSADLIRVTACG